MNLSKFTLGELTIIYYLAGIGVISVSGKEVLNEISKRARDSRQISALRDLRTYLGNYTDGGTRADQE